MLFSYLASPNKKNILLHVHHVSRSTRDICWYFNVFLFFFFCSLLKSVSVQSWSFLVQVQHTVCSLRSNSSTESYNYLKWNVTFQSALCRVWGQLKRQFVIIADNYVRKWYLPQWEKQDGLGFPCQVLFQSLWHCTSRCLLDPSDRLRTGPHVLIYRLDFPCQPMTLNGFLIPN